MAEEKENGKFMVGGYEFATKEEAQLAFGRIIFT